MELNQENILSQPSIIKHADGEAYTKIWSRGYDLLTTLSGWRKKIASSSLNELPQGKLLDVGCGTGYLLSLAQAQGFNVTGVDPSEAMLTKAKIQHGFNDNQLFQAPADKLPFDDSEFDIVIASGSLVYVPNLKEASEEILRVLKPGGRLRIIDHSQPQRKNLLTPFVTIFSQLSGDILHDYSAYFQSSCKELRRVTLGRGGYMQLFDFEKK